MQLPGDEEELLRSAALQNARSIQAARQRAERELLETQETLKRTNEHLTAILESITDGLVVLDGSWRITYMNPRAEVILGPLHGSGHPLVGKVVWEAFPDLPGTSFEEHCRHAIREKMAVEFELYYPPLDSWFEVRVFPSLDGLSVYFQDIGLRKRAELSLRESEDLLRATFDQAAVGIAVAGLDGTFQEINDKFCAILGYSRRELQGMSFEDLTHPDDRAATMALVRRLQAGEIRDYQIEKRYLRKDEAEVWSQTTVTLLRDAQGHPRRFLGVIQDISWRKHVELERERLSSILDKSLNEIYIFDTGTLRFQYVNKGALRNLGYSFESMRAMTPLDIKPLYGHAEFEELIDPLMRGERDEVVFETVHRRLDGSDYPVEVHLQLVAHAGQRVFLAVILDVTARKRAEVALRRSEEELRSLADSIPQLAWMAEPDGSIFWFNQRWYEYTGTSIEQVVGWNWQCVHDPEILPRVLERWKHSLRSGEPFEMEFPLRGADGTFRWFLTRVQATRDASGRVLRWFGTNTDVDQVRRIREALKDETRILELLGRTGTIVSSNLDLETLVQFVTDAATQLAGAELGAFFYNVTDDQGESFLLYTLSGAQREDFEKFGLPRNTPIFNPTFRGEAVVRSDDIARDPRYGKMAPHHGMPPGHFPVRSYLAVPVVSRSGTVIGGLFFGHSRPGMFTERQERIIVGMAGQAAIAIDNARLYVAAQDAAEERKQLLESERAARTEAERINEMKDEFLANLSHELRTPLSAIMGWTQVLRLRKSGDTDLQQGLETIERNARVQTQLIEDLLDTSRITSGKVRLDVRWVRPSGFIEAALETVRPAADAKGIRIEKAIDETAGLVSGDPDRLQQVLWNLLSNAVKFTPEGGKVQIVSKRVNAHIEIGVSDTGVGIKPEFIAHVFERFRQENATTARRFGGLGLGLSIVKHLVELHGGTVSVSSAGEGRGATFTLRLPAAILDGSEAALPEAQPATRAGAGRGVELSGMKVLVVDDEPDTLSLIARVLMDFGAQVVTATSARDALALVEQERPDLLVSDIAMPEVDGFELLERVRALGRERGGQIPAVAVTAFARPEDRARALRAGFLHHICKPFEPDELVANVARAYRRAVGSNRD